MPGNDQSLVLFFSKLFMKVSYSVGPVLADICSKMVWSLLGDRY